jgi:hypothetical protein
MALSPASRSVLLLAAFVDVILGLAFILVGDSLFQLEEDIALIIGLVLIGSGVSMAMITLIARRNAGPGVRRHQGDVVDRR